MMKKAFLTGVAAVLICPAVAFAQNDGGVPASDTAMPQPYVAQPAVTDGADLSPSQSSITSSAPDGGVVSVIDSNTLPPPMTASEQIVPQAPASGGNMPGNANVQPVADGTNMAVAQGVSAPQGGGASSPSQTGSIPDLTLQNWTSPVEREMAQQLAFVKPPVSAGAIKSLFLTLWESDLIADARRGLNLRPVADDPGALLPPDETGAQALTTDAPREITLGGIVYKSRKNWVIWLNGRRVSPNSIPNEVYDLKVNKEWIELEWFDSNTNQIFPIRMRTYQRFNLDSRIFLPG